MPRWATTVEIAGIVFTGCRAEVLDGEQFASEFRGSVDWGNDGSADAQMVNVGTRGNSFGIQMLSNEIGKVQDTLEAINAKLTLKQTFVVKIIDEMYSINVNAIPDFNQKWFSAGRPAEGWVENVQFRFVSKGNV